MLNNVSYVFFLMTMCIAAFPLTWFAKTERIEAPIFFITFFSIIISGVMTIVLALSYLVVKGIGL